MLSMAAEPRGLLPFPPTLPPLPHDPAETEKKRVFGTNLVEPFMPSSELLPRHQEQEINT